MAFLGKHQIAVNTSSLADGDSIASYLVDAAGNLLESMDVGGNRSLFVKSASEYAEDTAHADGDYGAFVMGVRNDAGTPLAADGDYIPFSMDANGALRVNAAVDMAGDYAEDSAHVDGDIGLFQLAVRRDARSSGVSADGDYASVNVNANGELWVHDLDVLTELLDQGTTLDSTLTELLDQGTTLDAILADTATIDSQTLSIQNTLTALSKAEDAAHSSGDQGIQALAVRKDAQASNAADGDYTSLQTWSEGSLKVVDVSNGAMLQQQVSVTSTAAAAPTSALANRKTLLLQNTSSVKMWVGSATVTTSGATAGIELPANGFMELEAGPAVPVYVIKNGAGGATLNVLEMA